MKIAIITSRFNEDITEKLYEGAIERARELNIPAENIESQWVPGAVELPLIAQAYAKRGDMDAIIVLGCVIQGDTDHYDYVCDFVTAGVREITLKFDLPVIFGVLTTQDHQQAVERVGGKHGHKGRYCMDAAVEMVRLMQSVAGVASEVS